MLHFQTKKSREPSPAFLIRWKRTKQMIAQQSEKTFDFPKIGKQVWISGNLKPVPGTGKHYPEYIAKTYNAAKCISSEEGFSPVEWSEWIRHRVPSGLYRCTRQFLHGSTTKADYLKSVTCGKDWCSDCGQIGSEAHMRRFNAILPRFKAMQQAGLSIGYLVVTIPLNLRHKFKDQDALKAFRDYWRRKLKREGYEYGAIRYHWAGEDGYFWNPHLNILFPSGYISTETLEIWRNELGQWFSDFCGLPPKKFWNGLKYVHEFPKANLNFHYLKPGKTEKEKTESNFKLVHWVKYIFRATQTQYNKETAGIIYKFRNTSIFGKKDLWPKIELNEEQILAKALKGFEVDKETGEIEKIVWHKDWNENIQKFVPRRIPVGLFGADECEKMGPGFYKRLKRIIPENYKPAYQPEPPERPAWLDKPKNLCSPEKPENMFCPF
jgi:hypothetical protein